MNQRQEAVLELLMGVLEMISDKPRSEFGEFTVAFVEENESLLVKGRTEFGGIFFQFRISRVGTIYSVYLDPMPNIRWLYLKNAIEKALEGLADGK